MKPRGHLLSLLIVMLVFWSMLYMHDFMFYPVLGIVVVLGVWMYLAGKHEIAYYSLGLAGLNVLLILLGLFLPREIALILVTVVMYAWLAACIYFIVKLSRKSRKNLFWILGIVFVLYLMSFFSIDTARYVPDKCTISGGISCIEYDASDDLFYISIQNNVGAPIDNLTISVSCRTGCAMNQSSFLDHVENGDRADFVFPWTTIPIGKRVLFSRPHLFQDLGGKARGHVEIDFMSKGQPRTNTGEFSMQITTPKPVCGACARTVEFGMLPIYIVWQGFARTIGY
ncbi:MAG: hypothetical protein ABIA93_00935 [Candidatus Woesearchaeota archaeon]